MTPLHLVSLVAVFTLVALLAGVGANAVLAARSVARRRLERVAPAGPVGAAVVAPVVLVDEPDPAAASAARFIPKSPSQMSRLQKQMVRAGYRHPLAPVIYAASELALPLALSGAALSWLGLRGGLLPAVLLAFIGYFLPGFLLAWRMERRKSRIRNGLPDALDLLIVCVEAGMGLDQAVQKAAEELQVSHPDLAEELGTITLEMRAGKPRRGAFRNFADRTKVDDVQSFVAMLAQTDRFGTSIAQALRTFADSSRTKRRQRAEERAAKLGVKLVFPLVLCLFPAMYVVTLGPAIIQFVRVLLENVMAR
jgi:tight adherence protein C